MSGASPAATPIDLEPGRRPNAFAQGLAAGVALSAVLVHIWLAIEMRSMRDMYRDFGTDALPVLTRLTLAPTWLFGVPAMASLALVFLVAKRPRALGWYVGLAAILFATTIGTYWFAEAPIRELAGNISS